RPAAAPIRRPRRPRGGSWRGRCPRCRAAPPARRSPERRRGRRRPPSARRRSPSPRSPAPATERRRAAWSATRATPPRASAHRAPTPQRRPKQVRCWRWWRPCWGENLSLYDNKSPRARSEAVALQRILVDDDPEPRSFGLVQQVALESALGGGDGRGEQTLRGEAMGEAFLGEAGRVEPLRQAARDRDPHRAVERA